MKYAAIILALVGCAHNKPTSHIEGLIPLTVLPEPSVHGDLEMRVKRMEDIIKSHSFMIDNDRCWLDYLLCIEKKPKNGCTRQQERCVVDGYRKFKSDSLL